MSHGAGSLTIIFDVGLTTVEDSIGANCLYTIAFEESMPLADQRAHIFPGTTATLRRALYRGRVYVHVSIGASVCVL